MKTLQWYDVLLFALIILLSACGGTSSGSNVSNSTGSEDMVFKITNVPESGEVVVNARGKQLLNTNTYDVGVRCANQPSIPNTIPAGKPGGSYLCDEISVWRIPTEVNQ